MKKTSSHIYKIRLSLVFSLVLILACVLTIRLAYLFIIQKQFFKQQGDARTVRTVTTPAYRGLILDRNGQPLAVSTAVATIWANPSLLQKDGLLAQFDYSIINKILDLPENTFEQKILTNKSKEFIYIKRHIPPDMAQVIDDLELPGVYSKREFKRYYPNGEVTAHITGFTSIDEVGQEGLESVFEDKLKGTPSNQLVLKDRLGRVIKTVKQQSVAKPGENISLSIDLRLQYLSYKALKETIDMHNASAGIAIMVDLKTGELLALANQPSFNPNDRINIKPKEVRNRALTDLFEPGSLLKPISMAAVLQANKFDDNYLVDTSPGYIKIGKHTIRDVRNYGELSLSNIIKKSSNIGISKLSLLSDPGNLTSLLYNLGFVQPVFANFPGEATGWINDVMLGEDHKLATLSFGYGIMATPIQLLQAYTIFANHGEFTPLTILKNQRYRDSRQVISAEVADSVLEMLNTVMQNDGTGRHAMLQNYNSAGKSGTTQRVTVDGYDKNSHNSMFIGMAPYPNPRLAMIVYVIDPKENGYYGGLVAGPVFKKVMPRALQLYGITPNNISAKS